MDKLLPVGAVLRCRGITYIICDNGRRQTGIMPITGEGIGNVHVLGFAYGSSKQQLSDFFGNIDQCVFNDKPLSEYFKPPEVRYQAGDVFYNTIKHMYYMLCWVDGWVFVGLDDGHWWNNPKLGDGRDAGFKLQPEDYHFVKVNKETAFKNMSQGKYSHD